MDTKNKTDLVKFPVWKPMKFADIPKMPQEEKDFYLTEFRKVRKIKHGKWLPNTK